MAENVGWYHKCDLEILLRGTRFTGQVFCYSKMVLDKILHACIPNRFIITLEVFLVHCVQRKWVVGGGGLNGHFREQGLQLTSKSALKVFTEDTLTTVCFKMVLPELRWSLCAWPRSPLQVGYVKVDSMGNS